MSLQKPVSAGMSQRFGNDFIQNGKWYYKSVLGYLGHNGNDYGAKEGDPVYAAADGVVIFEGWGNNHSWMGQPAGICVLLKHDDCHTGYAHLSSTVVGKGQTVKRGQLIGYVGATGSAYGSHLHFELLPLKPNFSNGYAGRLDPNPYIVDAPAEQRTNGTNGGSTVETIKSMYWRLLGREADQDGLNHYTKQVSDKGWEFVYNDLKNSAPGQADWQRRSPDAVAALEEAARNSQAKVATLERQLSDARTALENAQNKPAEVVTKEVEKIVTKEVPVYIHDEQLSKDVASIRGMLINFIGWVKNKLGK